MDFETLATTRRTIHNFDGAAVDDRLVRRALAVGLWSPNHKQNWPVRYVWVGPVARENLIQLALDLKPDASKIKRRAKREAIAGAAHLILLARRRAGKEKTAREDYATLAAAVQNITLSLWAEGVGTKWSTGGWTTDPRAYQIAGLNPAEFELDGCLLIGHAKFTPAAPPRPALDDVLTRVP